MLSNTDKLILLLIKLIIINLEDWKTGKCRGLFVTGPENDYGAVRPGLFLAENALNTTFDDAKVLQPHNPTKHLKHL